MQSVSVGWETVLAGRDGLELLSRPFCPGLGGSYSGKGAVASIPTFSTTAVAWTTKPTNDA